MPSLIEESQLQLLLESAEEIDSHDFRGESEDDYIHALLYSTSDGRHFRYVESSGYDSQFAGAGNIGEWLNENELEKWQEFD